MIDLILRKNRILGFILLTVVVTGWPVSSMGAPSKVPGGWDLDDPYNHLIRWTDLADYKGRILGIEEAPPLPGMSPAMILQFQEPTLGEVVVHVGPAWFVKDVDIQVGTRVKIRGVWAEIAGRKVLIASKIKYGDITVAKVRSTESGHPYWVASEPARSLNLGDLTGEKSAADDWSPTGPYGQSFVWGATETMTARVEDVIEIEPLPGMSPGVALIVRDPEGGNLTAHLGPKWFVGLPGFNKDDQVLLEGIRTEFGGRPVLVTSRVRKGDFYDFRLRRTKDGLPYWVLEPGGTTLTSPKD